MSEAFLKKPDGAYQVLAKQLSEAEEMKRSALRYSAHLKALVIELCDLLEKEDREFVVSEPLQMFWEREKRKREAKQCYLLSGTDLHNPDKRVGGGSGVESTNRVDGNKLVGTSSDNPVSKTDERTG